ncbi:MAG: hypothetical protein HY287_00240 [Planctomycetes bacterium]|nr:hypothetical protein [Planctomycetota bacterium]
MIRRYLPTLIALFVIATSLLVMIAWLAFRIYVPENMCAVLIHRSGTQLPAGELIAHEPGQKGIQEQVLGPGRYFYDPIAWSYELKPLTVIPAGNPTTWEWLHSLSEPQREALRRGEFALKGDFPKVGVVTRKVGKPSAPGQVVIVSRDSGSAGVLREVLTPGTYKINPYIYDVQLQPAVVVPAGFVGVVTNLFGSSASPLSAAPAPATENDSKGIATALDIAEPSVMGENALHVRPLVEAGQRGTVRDVLEPGVYFINPKLQSVVLVEIGYNEYTQTKITETENHRITFPSDTGFLISVGVTVVWGIQPRHAAEIINEFGNIDGVVDKVIGPQLRSICRNIGSTYAARDFIQGEKREMFQKALTAELQRVCRGKNLDVLIALVREIEVQPPGGAPKDAVATEDLKRTIQQSYIAIESQITKDKQRAAAATRAQLEEERKKVEIAREQIRAESRVLVAQILAEGEKQAAEIDAHAQLDVAAIRQEAAQFQAQRISTLGQAKADVEKMKNEAEAKGFELLVNAFGSGYAYNLYTFAENFQPQSIHLIYAGEGTFWTDLSRFDEAGAAKVLQNSLPKKGPEK